MRLLRILPFILFPLIFDPAFAQDDFINDSIKHPTKEKKKSNFWSWDKVDFGGSIGVLIGDPTFVDISPTMGYRLHKHLLIGAGPIYNYYRYKRYNFEMSLYGARTYIRPYIIDQVFLHGEYEWINGNLNYNQPGQRINVFGVLAGVGYQQSEEGGFFILALWELLKDPYYPYPNPILRMGFTIGM